MGKFILKRFLLAIPVLFTILTMVFVLMRLVPGNPIYSLQEDANLTPEQMEFFNEKYGLNGSILEQYGKYLRNVVKGDFGTSIFNDKPVFENIFERMDATLIITFYSTIITLLIGIPIGVYAATHHNSFLDYFLSSTSMLVTCVPSFCLGLGILYVFAFKLGWFPIFGYQSVEKYGFWNAVWSLTLPSVAIGLSGAASFARHTRAQMLDVLGQDYIRTARSKGMSERTINYRHGLRNVLSVLITLVSGTVVSHLGGSTVLEKVFNIRGVGLLAYDSLTNFDYTQEQAILLFFAVLFVFMNLFLDIVYKLLDPRIKLD